MKERLWLLLDQGGHAGRAMILDGSGSVLASAKHPVSTRRDSHFVEQDPGELLASLTQSLDALKKEIGSGAARIEAAGLITQRSSVVCWNRETGEPISAAISWQDRRAAKILENIPLDGSRIHELTGMRRSPHYGASKLKWCLDNLPAVGDALNAGVLGWGPLASFLLYGLLEEKPYLADATNAQRSLLWSFAGDWSRELCNAFGIPAASLPLCVNNRFEFGHIRFGERRIPLRMCAGDQNVVPFAFDAVEGAVFVNAGTGAFLLKPCEAFPKKDNGLLDTLMWQDATGQLFAEEGTVNGAGSALSWLAESENREIPWDELDTIFDEIREPPLFLNGIGGLGSPWWRHDFASRFIGMGGWHARLAAVIESVVFLIQANLERMKPQSVVITGGLSRSMGFCQRVAALAGVPVYRSMQTEASLHGLARKLAPQIPALEIEAIEAIKDKELENRYREFLARMP